MIDTPIVACISTLITSISLNGSYNVLSNSMLSLVNLKMWNNEIIRREFLLLKM